MSLLTEWRSFAYEQNKTVQADKLFWDKYFEMEKGVYKTILADYGTPYSGTVEELAEKFGLELKYFVGVLDGINDSLKVPNPIEEMTKETVVNMDYDPALLYKNMVAAKAEWLYNLEEWEPIFSEEKRKELYKEQKTSTTIVKDKKIGRNDPCPCGSGKKYKFCCGR